MNKFIEHINLTNPQFVCRRSGHDIDQSVEWKVSIEHKLGAPASAQNLAIFNAKYSQFKDLVALYSLHDGMQLYCHYDNYAIEFFRLEEMYAYTEDFRKNTLQYFLEDGEEGFEYLLHGLIFGRIGFSSNYFWLYDGKVYATDPKVTIHPKSTISYEARSESFDAFLDGIAENPARFLYDMGCYTRYYDGKSDYQWIPKKIIFY